MNTMIEEIRKRIKARMDNTDAAGDYDEYADGQGVGLAAALRIIDEVEKEHPIPADVQEAAEKYEEKATEIAERTTSPFQEELTGPAPTYSDAFEAGAEWQRDRLMKEAVEGTLGYGPHLLRPIVMLEQVPKIWDGSSSNPVSVIIIKKEK